jgi:triphosphoribosyl-dephospho-CoA synthase
LNRPMYQNWCVQLGKLATAALLSEAELTPKPALVDRRGSGAHSDLTLESMLKSARVLEPFFVKMASIAGSASSATPTQELREALANCGRQAETAMLSATGGSNSHRGAIWCLGLLVAGASMYERQCCETQELTSKPCVFSEVADNTLIESSNESRIQQIGFLAAQIAAFTDRNAPALETHGLVMRRLHGAGGARFEAQSGFPHVVHTGVPFLRSQRLANIPETACRLNTLLAIMSSLDDTCLLYRGGLSALESARAGAREVLSLGGTHTPSGMARLFQLDKKLLELGASPGGSADLLAATLFLDSLEKAPDLDTNQNQYGAIQWKR